MAKRVGTLEDMGIEFAFNRMRPWYGADYLCICRQAEHYP
jgi:hypothetical protein